MKHKTHTCASALCLYINIYIYINSTNLHLFTRGQAATYGCDISPHTAFPNWLTHHATNLSARSHHREVFHFFCSQMQRPYVKITYYIIQIEGDNDLWSYIKDVSRDWGKIELSFCRNKKSFPHFSWSCEAIIQLKSSLSHTVTVRSPPFVCSCPSPPSLEVILF